MPTRPVWPFALVAALALVVIWVAAASPVFVVGEPYRTSGPTAPEASPTGFPTGPLPTGGPGTQTPFPVPDWVGWIINGGAVLALVLLALAVGRWLLRRRSPVRRPAASTRTAADALLADAAEQLAVLGRGPVGDAIIACWQRLEDAIARAGTPAKEWETPTEVTQRVLSRYAVDPAALACLGALYREARFSAHSLGEPERRRAADALERIHAGLATSAGGTGGAAADRYGGRG